jgi:hypothetical protein
MAVARGADGSLWVAHADETATQGGGEDRPMFVERFDAGLGAGRIVAQSVVRPNDFTGGSPQRVALCSHPSGEVTLATFAAVAGETSGAALMLTRFAADGARLRTGFIDEPEAEVKDGHSSYSLGNDADCVADGDEVLLLAPTTGVKLYRIAADLTVSWRQLVMPLTANLALGPVYDTRARVALAPNGDAVTALTLWVEDAAAFTQAFGETLPPTSGVSDVLVTRFGRGGARISAGLLGGPEVERVRGVNAAGDQVAILAEIRVKKDDEPNQTLERDVLLLRGDPARNITSQAVQIDLCRDEFISGALPRPDGGFWVAGSACRVQADSGSLIANGKGFVLGVGPDGARGGVTWFTGDRDTDVQAVAVSTCGDLAVGGFRNGPLTHTDPSELENQGWIGIVDPP